MSEAALSEVRVGNDVWVWTLGGESLDSSYGANCTAVVGRKGVLLVDPFIAPAHARLVEAAVGEKTDLPISLVLLTHHHTDHALGAGWFARKGVPVLAHPACAAAMAREHPGLIASRRRIPAVASLFEDAEPYAPSMAADRFEWQGAEIIHPGANHTPGDLVIHLPGESLTICGDLVSVGYHVNYEDADRARLEHGLRALLARGFRTYVPGHGAPGGAEIVEAQLEYHRLTAQASAEEIRARYPEYLLEEVLR